LLPVSPSISPGEKCARSSRTWARSGLSFASAALARAGAARFASEAGAVVSAGCLELESGTMPVSTMVVAGAASTAPTTLLMSMPVAA
jgi:hypothetical protein